MSALQGKVDEHLYQRMFHDSDSKSLWHQIIFCAGVVSTSTMDDTIVSRSLGAVGADKHSFAQLSVQHDALAGRKLGVYL